MKTIRGAELDALLRIDAALIQRLKAMSARGSTLEELILFLKTEGFSKAGTNIALRRAEIGDGNEMKRAVHFSAAFADRRKLDEEFEATVMKAAARLERTETTA